MLYGNPPYIKYKSLKENDRKYVKQNFQTCQRGKFDYCYAFIEKSIESLKVGGKMAYLIPSSIFKNVFANDLREYIKSHIVAIYDYTTERLFKEDTDGTPKVRLTSSAIMIIEKNSNLDTIIYHDVVKNKSTEIIKEKLNDKWVFKNRRKSKNKESDTNKFGYYYNVSNTIATLYNKAYVINATQQEREDENFIYLKGGHILEKKIVKQTASPRNLRTQITEKIIFPYNYINGKIERYTEEEFERNFPNTSNYLRLFNTELAERRSDENAKWFEYGRSQSLHSIKDNKLLISTIITKQVNVYELPDDAIPYSGIYIQPIRNKNLEEAITILKSNKFLKYIEEVGIHASGESYRITSKDIKNYVI